MKKIILFLLFSWVYTVICAQTPEPIVWKSSTKKIAVNTYELHCTATIEKGWHTYSQTTPEGGPVPTSLSFSKNPIATLVGVVKEVGELEKHNEPLFGVIVKQFSDKVDFVQTVKLKASVKTNIAGTVDYMLCNNKECLPPAKKTFSVFLN